MTILFLKAPLPQKLHSTSLLRWLLNFKHLCDDVLQYYHHQAKVDHYNIDSLSISIVNHGTFKKI